MREIKYRALDKNKNWVFGLPFYSHGLGEWKMTFSDGWKPTYNDPDKGEETIWKGIDPKTLGEFTGLTDSQGKEIYEGDIIVYKRSYCFGDGYDGEPIDTDRTETIIGRIVFYPTKGWQLRGKSTAENDIDGGLLWKDRKYCSLPSRIREFATVLGNIHQNPELLKQ